MSEHRQAPDDTKANEAISAAQDLPGALLAIAAKYGMPLTDGEAHWADGRYVHPATEFVGDMKSVFGWFPQDVD